MALLWSEGFGAYGGSVPSMLDGSWAEVVTTGAPAIFALSTARARTGAYSLAKSVNPSVGDARRVFGGTKTTVGIGFALYMDNLPLASDRVRFSFRDNANAEQVRVVVQSTGDIAAIRGSATLGATTTPPLSAAAWNHVEIKVVCHATAGAVEVRVNQVTVLNLTGVNTKNTALTGVDQISFSNISSQPWPQSYIDDLFAWDTLGAGPTDFVGDKKVLEDFANADGAEQDWIRSSGSASWPLLAESPPDGDTSYVSTAFVGGVMGLKFPALPVEVSSVTAISFEHVSRKTDAGSADLTGGIRSGESTVNGPSTPVTTAYTRRRDIFTVNPATGAPFTPVAAGAAEYRLTRSA